MRTPALRRLRRRLAILVLVYFFAGAASQKLVPGVDEIIPFYGWSLFSKVPNEDSRYVLLVHRHKRRNLEPPVSFLHAPDTIVAGNRYIGRKVIQRLGKAVERGQAAKVKDLRRLLEQNYFRGAGALRAGLRALRPDREVADRRQPRRAQPRAVHELGGVAEAAKPHRGAGGLLPPGAPGARRLRVPPAVARALHRRPDPGRGLLCDPVLLRRGGALLLAGLPERGRPGASLAGLLAALRRRRSGHRRDPLAPSRRRAPRRDALSRIDGPAS